MDKQEIKPNNIYLGDSYELIKEIPDKSIDLVYTDIPYLFKTGGGGHSKLANRIIKMNEQDLKDIRNGIDYSIFDELVRVMKYIYIYIWCSKEQIRDITNIFIGKYNCNFNILVWCKTNPTPMTNNVWLPDVEYCLVFKEPNAPRYNDGYEIKKKWYVSAINKADKDKYLHPTIKPLEMVKNHLKHSTNEGDLVLDCFAGSGTTLKACKDLNRQYIGFEINPTYYKIAKDRLENINAKGEVSLF